MSKIITEELLLDLVKVEIKEQVRDLLWETQSSYDSYNEVEFTRTKMGALINGVIKEEIKNALEIPIGKAISVYTQFKVGLLIEDILAKETTFGDGWNDNKLTFNELVIKKLKENVSESAIQRQVNSLIDDKIKIMIQQKAKEHSMQIVDEILNKKEG